MAALTPEERLTLFDLIEDELRHNGHASRNLGLARHAVMYVVSRSSGSNFFEGEDACTWFDKSEQEQLKVVIDTLSTVLESEMNDEMQRRLDILRSYVGKPFVLA